MQSYESQLVSLLLALFEKSGTRRRFIRLLSGGTSATLDLGDKASRPEQVEHLVTRLSEHNLINNDLFDALLKSRPDRKQDIERVRVEMLGPSIDPGGLPIGSQAEELPADKSLGVIKGSKDGYLPIEEEINSPIEDGNPAPRSSKGDSTVRKRWDKRRPAESSKTEPSKAEPSKAEPSKAESSKAESSKTLNPRDAWRQEMAALLGSIAEDGPTLPEPWLAAAAVLPSFDPLSLQPMGSDVASPRDLLERLAGVCETLVDGRLSLELRTRQDALANLWRRGQLLEALDANSASPSIQERWLRRALEIGSVDTLELKTLQDLQTAHQLAEWLARSDFEPFDRDRVASVLERFRRVEPLRRLLGKHFRGRKTEVERLRRHLRIEKQPAQKEQHVQEEKSEPILVLWGVGGVGKSTLLGKVLLDLETTGDPWVYLDFDDPEVDPLDSRRLLELIARQLGQFFASAAVAEAFLAVEFAAAEDDSLQFDVKLDRDVKLDGTIDPQASLDQLLVMIDRGLRSLPRPPALSLVFDTFEQVQVRGRHAVAAVRRLLDTVSKALPFAKIIISGRAMVSVWGDAEPLELGDLDDEGADQVLIALGVDDEKLRQKVLSRVGSSPLSLRLAADALNAGRLNEDDLESMVVRVRRFEMQGQLYTRILGHIRDGEVRRLAHPGLIVRRVTIGVIREVLADLCDLDPENAAKIFERLPNHVALFEPDDSAPDEGAALRHRQDVREIMLRLMIEDPAWKDRLKQIHRRAVQHYDGRDDDLARAEVLYHRLMRDDDPADLDSLWRPTLVDSLARCWEEPLPDRARAWLGPRIGRAEGDLEAWRTEDWEISVAREVGHYLQRHQFQGALDLLKQRKERSPGSPLFELEAKALLGLERWQETEAVVERGLAGDVETLGPSGMLSLHLAGGEAMLHLDRRQSSFEHIERAFRIATEIQDLSGRIRALDLRIQLSGGGPDDASVQQLEQVFLEARDADLRRDAELSRRALELLRPHSTAVLRKVATVFGNRADQEVIRLDAFKLEDLLQKVKQTDAGKASLSKLAGDVGLPAESFGFQDLASQSILYGKLGDALITVLDHAGDNEEIREGAEGMLRDFDVKGGF